MRIIPWPKAQRPRLPLRQRRTRLLRVEYLEDRVVPSVPDGTILVATSHSAFSSVPQDSFPIGIIGITPSTGSQFAVSTGGLFSLPTYVIEAPDGQLYVTDLQAFTTGAVIRVDTNGGQHLVSRGGFLNGPNGLAYVNGFLYVANTGDGSGTVHSIVRIDPNTGQQQLITSGGGFVVPTGMAPGPNNSIYVSDEPGGSSGADPGGVWQVDCTTGVQTQITHGGYIVHASDVAVDPNGNLITMGATSPSDYVGAIVRTDPNTGVQTQVSHDGILYYLDDVTVDLSTGTIYSGAISTGYIPAALYAIDPNTGAQSQVAQDGLMSLVEGARVYHATIQTASSTIVNSSANPAPVGQMVTFTATVSSSGSGTPTGTVTFMDGSTTLGQGTLTTAGGSTTASFSTASLGSGGHTITASYAGDGNFSSSSGAVTQLMTTSTANTSTVLSSAANPAVFGQIVPFTATVSSSGAGTPTGVVIFSDGSTSIGQGTLTSSGGVTAASFSTAGLGIGGHSITALYLGDGTFQSSAATFGQTIGKASTSTAVSSSANPSAPNQTVTFTATLTITAPGSAAMANPSGVVTFSDGATSIGQGALSTSGGVTTASFTTAGLGSGNHTLTASYVGDGNFLASSGSMPQMVGKAGTSTVVSSSANPSALNQAVTFTATVTINAPGNAGAGNPSGIVLFADGSSTMGQATLSTVAGKTTASFTTSNLSAGSHNITALYLGDSNFSGSAGAVTQETGKVSTSITVVSAANPAVTGQSILLTALITATPLTLGTMTGTVQFLVDGTSVGNPVKIATLAGITSATLTVTLGAGTHTVAVSYSGDSVFAAGTGVLSGGERVNKANTTTTVASSANPSDEGQSVTFTATVMVAAPGSKSAGNPTGGVVFSDGNTSIGRGTLSTVGGVTTATFRTSSLSKGHHSITATYTSGDANFNASPASPSIDQHVKNGGDGGGGAAPSSGALVSASPIPAADGSTATAETASGLATTADVAMERVPSPSTDRAVLHSSVLFATKSKPAPAAVDWLFAEPGDTSI